ncbi:ABC transporter permease [Pelatocladus sp. BLCC-F211]|uniref:ABC transporter permease n=1 Tax=Pelatocladus sp. BLCC-F211 TaxID=3342752 RepID=UPI0035B8E9FB
MDFLAYLAATLPPPIFALVIGVLTVICLLLYGVGLYIFFVVLYSVPSLRFLFTDIDEMITQWLKSGTQQRSSQKTRRKASTSCRTTNHELQRKLLQLLRGDKATANRLIRQQRQMHPGRSDKWYLEKAIWDLERDRH